MATLVIIITIVTITKSSHHLQGHHPVPNTAHELAHLILTMSLIIPTFQIRKLRPIDIKQVVQGCTVCEGAEPDLAPGRTLICAAPCNTQQKHFLNPTMQLPVPGLLSRRRKYGGAGVRCLDLEQKTWV